MEAHQMRITDNAHKIETSLGPLYLTFTSADHVCAHTSRQNDSALTVNRVQYSVNAHVYLWSDGTWNLGEEGKDAYQRRQSLHATRFHWIKVSDMYPSQPARDKMTSVVEQAVRNFAVSNAGIIRAAQLQHLQEELEKAEVIERETREAHGTAELARQQAAQALNDFEVKA
jgi:hypothetical protein